MPNAFTRALSTPVPQSEAENDRQVENNAGGYTFTVDAKSRLERFLILGTDGGTYYVGERDLTKQNLDFLKSAIAADEVGAWRSIEDVSVNARSYRNSAALLATAFMFQYGTIKDDAQERAEYSAYNLGMKVVRTATHLYEICKYFELVGGWNRQKRRFVADWFANKGTDGLAYQAVKYRQRDGWTLRDLFRLSHPKGVDTNLGNFILGKDDRSAANTQDGPEIIKGFKFAQEAETVSELLNVALSDYHNLPWEALPTQFLKDPSVWRKLFYNGQLNGQALVRNITRLARIHAFDDMVFAADYAAELVDEEMIAKTRLHPINYLNALTVHTEGQVVCKSGFLVWNPERKKDWATVPVIVDALNEGFHLSFKHVEPAGKRTMLGLDISGSMSQNANGLDLSCAQVCGAMAMTVARTEPYYNIRGFSSSLVDLGITPKMDLNSVMKQIARWNYGATDCSLPMIWALQNKIEVDTFQVYTDNETWAGRIHPHVALREYRQKMGIDAKLAVVGITATNFTIADPQDRGMMDFVGADSNMPKIMADFSGGRI